jgi:hypothetical protein
MQSRAQSPKGLSRSLSDVSVCRSQFCLLTVALAAVLGFSTMWTLIAVAVVLLGLVCYGIAWALKASGQTAEYDGMVGALGGAHATPPPADRARAPLSSPGKG